MPEGERPEESPSSVGTTAVRGTRTFLNPDQLGAVGSYASFFGCLLIATVLAFQEIFSAAHDLVQRRAFEHRMIKEPARPLAIGRRSTCPGSISIRSSGVNGWRLMPPPATSSHSNSRSSRKPFV